MHKIKIFLVAMCLAVTLAVTVSAHEKSLYERLGGQAAITAVIDDFIERAAADTRINRKFAKNDVSRLRTYLVEQICAVTGGSCRTIEGDVVKSRLNIEVTNSEFKALMEDFVASLDKFRVPANEKNELLGIIRPIKGRIMEVNSVETASGQGASSQPAGTRCVPLRIPR